MDCQRQKNIKAIIFDVGGVLKITDVDATKEKIVSQFGISSQNIMQSYNKYLPLWKSSQIFESELWHKTITDYVPDHQNFQRIFKLNEPVYQIAKKLEQLGYITAILSNVSAEDKIFNSQLNLYAPFKEVILSCDVNLIKPNPAIFNLTLEKLKVKPSEAVMVDDKEINLDSAKGIGIHTIYFQDEKQLKNDLEKLLAVDLSEC
jgi:putative hydrolase of the HAD superfamily